MEGNGAAAAAQTIRTIKIGDKNVAIGKLVFDDYASAKEQAADEYKRNLILTYTKNQDLLPDNMKATAIQEAFLRAEQITADSLPPKMIWYPKRDPNNGKVVLNTEERFFHKESRQWIGKGAPLLEQIEVEYSGWWMSNTNSGKIFASWLAMKKCPGQTDWTLNDVMGMLQDDSIIEEAATAVGKLSEQKLGNASPPMVAGAIAS